MRHRQVQQIVQGHLIGKWQGQDSNPDNLAPKSKLLPIHYCCFSGCTSGLCTKFCGSLYHALSFPTEAYSRGYSHTQYMPPCILWSQKFSRNNLSSYVRAHLKILGIIRLISWRQCKERTKPVLCSLPTQLLSSFMSLDMQLVWVSVSPGVKLEKVMPNSQYSVKPSLEAI